MKKQKSLEGLKSDLNLFDSDKVFSRKSGGEVCTMTGPKEIGTNRNGSPDKEKIYDIVCSFNMP